MYTIPKSMTAEDSRNASKGRCLQVSVPCDMLYDTYTPTLHCSRFGTPEAHRVWEHGTRQGCGHKNKMICNYL